MFSAFEYFETKQLSLAGLCYIMTMAFLCALYFILDRPDYPIEKSAGYLIQSNDWVRFELSDDIQAKDIHYNLSHVISRLDMQAVSFIVECDDKNCMINFIPLSNSGKEVAKSAIGHLRNLQL